MRSPQKEHIDRESKRGWTVTKSNRSSASWSKNRWKIDQHCIL